MEAFISKTVAGVLEINYALSPEGKIYALVLNQVVWYKIRVITQCSVIGYENEFLTADLSQHAFYSDASKTLKAYSIDLTSDKLTETKKLLLKMEPKKCSVINQDEVKVKPDRYFARGQHISIVRLEGIYEHHGIYVGEGVVIHISKGEDSKTLTYPKIDTLKNFIDKDHSSTIYAFDYIYTYSEDKRVEKALQCLTEGFYDNYNLLTNNCEHFCRFVMTSKSASSQVDKAALMMGLGLAIRLFTIKV